LLSEHVEDFVVGVAADRRAPSAYKVHVPVEGGRKVKKWKGWI
jgi:hypothetical protein